MKDLIEAIKEIAKKNPEGFTISIKDLSHVKRGWVVAMKETQNNFGDKGLIEVLEIAQKTSHIMGEWKEGKLFYYDAVWVIEEKEEAIQIGMENEQIAIYNIETATLIYL